MPLNQLKPRTHQNAIRIRCPPGLTAKLKAQIEAAKLNGDIGKYPGLPLRIIKDDGGNPHRPLSLA